MRPFPIPINLDLNRRGFREGHKPLHLSTQPKNCAQPPDSMTSFAKKTISKRCDWCKISECYDMIGARYIP